MERYVSIKKATKLAGEVVAPIEHKQPFPPLREGQTTAQWERAFEITGDYLSSGNGFFHYGGNYRGTIDAITGAVDSLRATLPSEKREGDGEYAGQIVWPGKRPGPAKPKPDFVSGKENWDKTLAMAAEVVYPIGRKNSLYPPSESKSWVRNWEVVGMYLGTSWSVSEIAERLGLTGPRVRQIIQKGIGELWGSLPYSRREPYREISMRKPESDEHWERIHGDKPIAQIKKAVAGGASLRDLKEMGFAGHNIENARAKGAEISYERNNWTGLIGEITDPSCSLERVKEIMAVVNMSAANKYRKAFTSLTSSARAAGLNPNHQTDDIRIIAAYLEERGVPVTVLKYSANAHSRLLLKRMGDKAVELLLSAQGERFDAMRGKVSCIGPNVDFAQRPTTTDFVLASKGEGNFVRVGQLNQYFSSVKFPGTNRLAEVVGERPPVTVFRNGRNGMIVAKKDAWRLANHIAARVKGYR